MKYSPEINPQWLVGNCYWYKERGILAKVCVNRVSETPSYLRFEVTPVTVAAGYLRRGAEPFSFGAAWEYVSLTRRTISAVAYGAGGVLFIDPVHIERIDNFVSHFPTSQAMIDFFNHLKDSSDPFPSRLVCR